MLCLGWSCEVLDSGSQEMELPRLSPIGGAKGGDLSSNSGDVLF